MAVVEATDPQKQAEPVADAAPPSTSEPQSSPPQATAAPAPGRSGGAGAFFATVLGGVVAAGLGFGLARAMPDLLPIAATDDAVSAAVETQAQEIATLREQLAALPTTATPDPEMQARLADIASAQQALTGRLDALEGQIAELVARPAASGDAVPADLAAELAALKGQMASLSAGGSLPADVVAAAEAAEARLKAAEESAAAMADQARAATESARRDMAIDRIAAALDSGAAYASALADLPEGTVPPALADHAATGLPTVADLSDSFPQAARDALEAALRANMGESWTDRVASFLRSQTGLRSLTPREGDDPDAILSRAEAALAAGRVADAVQELQAMPEAGKPALADWLDAARIRIEAESAVAALAAN
ncbi:MAG: mitofilin family membrane protein [Paracoccaceae bacterium]